MAIEIFFCYAREDEELRKGLEKQLRALKRQGIIDVWHDREIGAGTEWEREIDKHLNSAQIILLLVSPDFMDSDYCYSKEMTQAMERHERGEARVIPVILRPVYWQGSPFGKLQALPMDAKAINSRQWHNLDEAFFEVAEGIRKAVEELTLNLALISKDVKVDPLTVIPTLSIPLTSPINMNAIDSSSASVQSNNHGITQEPKEQLLDEGQITFDLSYEQNSSIQSNTQKSKYIEQPILKVTKEQSVNSHASFINEQHLTAALIERIRQKGTEKQLVEAIKTTTEWLAVNPQNTDIRRAYLTLVSDKGTEQQAIDAIKTTTEWLAVNPQNIGIRRAYLDLVKRRGTEQQCIEAIKTTAEWLDVNPQDTGIRRPYLALLTEKGTEQQCIEAIKTTAEWLAVNPQNTRIRRAYLEIMRQRGTEQQCMEAIKTTSEWLAVNPQDTGIRRAYLELISQRGTE